MHKSSDVETDLSEADATSGDGDAVHSDDINLSDYALIGKHKQKEGNSASAEPFKYSFTVPSRCVNIFLTALDRPLSGGGQ